MSSTRQSKWVSPICYQAAKKQAYYTHLDHGFYTLFFCNWVDLQDGGGYLPMITRKCSTERQARQFCKRWCTDPEFKP